ncbi:MAG: PHP domain-containing protein [Candidatus Hydrogenedentes bacterium]|nr:PHP domain-containing protein [Candidatus Hydrogenedentota bacterium]
MPFVDLHLHSTCSDGSDPPETVAARAKAAGAVAIALTDHDTMAGVPAARAAAEALGLGYISGVEISAGFEGREIHVIGLGLDHEDTGLVSALEALRAARDSRGRLILARLAELGVGLPAFEIGPVDSGSALGRMHIAQAMAERGYVKQVQEAFDRYLNPGRPAFVPKETIPLAASIDLIHGAGGLAFLAHPGLGNWVRKALPALLAFPFDGIEAYHVSHSPGRTEGFLALARERGLLVTGGSDCHGTIKGKALLGSVQTPERVFAAIMARLRSGLLAE